MRMITALLAIAASVGSSELTPYTTAEVDQLVKAFKAVAHNPRIPEEDAVVILTDLDRAYRFFASRKDKATAAERKAQAGIVAAIASGLVEKRPLVALVCARALRVVISRSTSRWATSPLAPIRAGARP